MICDFIARTNWSNIKNNYFVKTIIIFNLSYYTNIAITVTFVNHLMLCRAFLFFSPKYHLYKSCTIFHINLYVFNILTEVFLTAPTSLIMWSGWPSFKTNRSEFHTALWIILAVTGISVCLMASSLQWKVCHQRIGHHLHGFFLDLVWWMKLPSPIASFQ